MPPSNNSNGVVKAVGSSGSSEGCSKYDGMDEKKRRRMESNRESARRSRQKKQQHLDDLIKQVGGLTRQNAEIEKKIKEVSGIMGNYEAQNKVLKSEKDRLAASLESLESIIDIAMVVRGTQTATATATTSIGNHNCNYNYNNYNYNNNNSYDNLGELLYMYEGNNNGDPMMKPWQLACPSMPLIASSGLPYSFKF